MGGKRCRLTKSNREAGLLERKMSRLLHGSHDYKIKSLNYNLILEGMKSGIQAELGRWWMDGRVD
jgi:hypothetical protein